jgi:hypothetical protein
MTESDALMLGLVMIVGLGLWVSLMLWSAREPVNRSAPVEPRHSGNGATPTPTSPRAAQPYLSAVTVVTGTSAIRDTRLDRSILSHPDRPLGNVETMISSKEW